MRAAVLLGGLLLSVVPAASAGAVVDTDTIARALARQPVYLQPGAEISARDARQLRKRIDRKNPGRIQLVVLDPADAARSGGVRELANAIDQAGRPPGTLIVAAGGSFYAVTTYPQAERAASAIRTAVSRHEDERLATQLEAAVDAVARVDPGAGSDLGAPRQQSQPGAGSPADNVSEAIGTAFVIVAIACAVILLAGALWLFVRWRRRQAEVQEALAEEFAAAEERLIALGDDIRLLDLDVSMPGADPGGRAAYERAVALYEQLSRALNKKPTHRNLTAATTMLVEAQSAMHDAKRRLERPT